MSATETKQKLIKHVNLSTPLRPEWDKTNEQGVQGDRTGRIFNTPINLCEYQTEQGQEAVLTFKKGENK